MSILFVIYDISQRSHLAFTSNHTPSITFGGSSEISLDKPVFCTIVLLRKIISRAQIKVSVVGEGIDFFSSLLAAIL